MELRSLNVHIYIFCAIISLEFFFKHSLMKYKWFLFDPLMRQVLPLQVRVDLGAVKMKGYSTFRRFSELEIHYQM